MPSPPCRADGTRSWKWPWRPDVTWSPAWSPLPLRRSGPILLLAWAEDRATQGCDLSADPGAGTDRERATLAPQPRSVLARKRYILGVWGQSPQLFDSPLARLRLTNSNASFHRTFDRIWERRWAAAGAVTGRRTLSKCGRFLLPDCPAAPAKSMLPLSRPPGPQRPDLCEARSR